MLSKNLGTDWSLSDIRRIANHHYPGMKTVFISEVDSTNSTLIRRIRLGDKYPMLLITDRQSVGRGCFGRTWHTINSKQALTFSIGLPYKRQCPSGLSIIPAFSMANYLNTKYKLAVTIKWPNDLWVQGKKLAGILIETIPIQQPEPFVYLVVGIGINITPPETTKNYRTTPTSLRDLGLVYDANTLLLDILPDILKDIRWFLQSGLSLFMDNHQV
jgi:BirA family biotin operon repressor/biotin-[acetyl-CoA-carboxylase] ligase